MLELIEVRDYQSLAKARVPLRGFTVITGPSGAGKSALLRAMLQLACNGRGTSYIRTGAASCTVAVRGDRWAVRLTRSAGRGKNAYEVSRRDDGGKWHPDAPYTKLGGQVPDQVAALTGLTELNFARQMHLPFLLAQPPTAIARTLGDLTNVSLVLGAAAEANRRRKALARDLESAQKRRRQLKAEYAEFAGLQERRTALGEAESALERVRVLAERIGALEALADRLELHETRLELATAEAERAAPPSLERLDALLARISRLRQLAGALEAAERAARSATVEAERAEAEAQETEAAVHARLAEIGWCPLCSQAVA